MTPLNEAFASNMTAAGATIEYDIQPYEHAKGKITAITHRNVERKDFDIERGGIWIRYEVFDLTVEVIEGHHQGAFWGGVAIGKAQDLAGTVRHIHGVSAGQLRRAVLEGKCIVQATCG